MQSWVWEQADLNGFIAHLVRASEENSVIVGLILTQHNFLKLLLKILQWRIPYVSIHSSTNVIASGRLRIKQMRWLNNAKNKIKPEHWAKRWNWSISTKLALTASWNQWPTSSVCYSISMEFSGRGLNSHSDQFSIGVSKNPLLVNTICINSFRYQRDYLCETSLKENDVANYARRDRNETWTLNKEMKLE